LFFSRTPFLNGYINATHRHLFYLNFREKCRPSLPEFLDGGAVLYNFLSSEGERSSPKIMRSFAGVSILAELG
jgi:hypothetical protein